VRMVAEALAAADVTAAKAECGVMAAQSTG